MIGTPLLVYAYTEMNEKVRGCDGFFCLWSKAPFCRGVARGGLGHRLRRRLSLLFPVSRSTHREAAPPQAPRREQAAKRERRAAAGSLNAGAA